MPGIAVIVGKRGEVLTMVGVQHVAPDTLEKHLELRRILEFGRLRMRARDLQPHIGLALIIWGAIFSAGSCWARVISSHCRAWEQSWH